MRRAVSWLESKGSGDGIRYVVAVITLLAEQNRDQAAYIEQTKDVVREHKKQIRQEKLF